MMFPEAFLNRASQNLPPCCPRSCPWSCGHCLSQQSFYSALTILFLFMPLHFHKMIHTPAPKVHPKVQVFRISSSCWNPCVNGFFQVCRLQKINFYNIIAVKVITVTERLFHTSEFIISSHNNDINGITSINVKNKIVITKLIQNLFYSFSESTQLFFSKFTSRFELVHLTPRDSLFNPLPNDIHLCVCHIWSWLGAHFFLILKCITL